MTPVPDFIADLLRADTSVKEAKLADDVYGQNLLKMRVIYDILRLVKAGEKTDDKRRFNPKKITRMTNLIATVAAAIEEDCRVRVQFLAKAFDTCAGNIFNIIHDDLGLVKKSARCLTKLLLPNQTEKRVETLAAWCRRRGRAS
jgi:hypothetical protein